MEVDDINDLGDINLDVMDETDDINLGLGQIIKLSAPNNDDLHEKIFFIDYLDEKTITLIHQTEERVTQLNVNNGIITDESILEIDILYDPPEDGYARQNNLIVGEKISIEFGGKVPQIINGEITNLEEDMIEINVYNTNKKIYIEKFFFIVCNTTILNEIITK